jgi:alanine dehydrogenase
MSEIAGRLSIQEAAKYLEKPMGGKGVLLAGVPGVKKGHVLILGAGNAGLNAAKVAVGMGANVTILDRNILKLEEIEQIYGDRIQTLYSTQATIEKLLPTVDAVIGAVLIAGAKTPHLISRDELKLMEKGSVLVDIAIDQGGCFEMSHPTTHNDPIFEVDGIIHYCVANMPGAVAMTSTVSLTNAAFHYELLIADNGLKNAVIKENALKSAINTYNGQCIHPAVAQTFGLEVESYHV